MNQCRPYRCPKDKNHNRFREIYIVVMIVDGDENITEIDTINLGENEPTAVFCDECDEEVSV